MVVDGLIDGPFEGAVVGIRVEGFTEGVNELEIDGMMEVGIILGEREVGFNALGMTDGTAV